MAGDEQILLIGGAPRTGTTLLVRLFDAHPQAVVWPTELTMLRKYWECPKSARLDFVTAHLFSDRSSQEHLIVDAAARARRRAQKLEEMGQDLDIDVDADRFVEAYQAAVVKGGAGFDSVLRAMGRALCLSSISARQSCKSPRLLVFKIPYYMELYADRIAAEAPSVHLLHIMRHPIARFVSAKRRRLRPGRLRRQVAPRINGLDFVTGSCEVTFSSQRLAFQQQRELPRYQVLHFETLISRPEETMRDLASMLGIDYTDTLLTPTQAGTPIRPNTAHFRDTRSFGTHISPEITEYEASYKEITNAAERTYLEYLCQVANADPFYEFPVIDARRVHTAWRHRFKHERLRDFVVRQIPGAQSLDAECVREQLRNRLPSLARSGAASVSGAT